MLDRQESERFDCLWTMEDETWDAKEIHGRVMEKINGENSSKRKWRKKSLIVLLAAVIAVMGTISFGAERDWDIQFAEFIGADAMMPDLPGGYKEIGVSQTVDGVTVTITKSIGDRQSQWIQMDTTMKWCGENPEKAYFADFHVEAKDAGYGGMTATPFEQEGKVSYLIEMVSCEGINHSVMEFRGVTETGAEFYLQWKNYYTANTVKYYPMKWIEEMGDRSTAEKYILYCMDVTPISIKIKALGRPNFLRPEGSPAVFPQIESIQLKSGEVITLDGYRVAGHNSSGKMESYLPLIGIASGYDISSVTVSGTEIEL